MVRGGRAESHVPRSDVSFRLDQKTANFKIASASRALQCSFSRPEEKQKHELAQKRVFLHKNNNNNNKGGGGGQLPEALRLYISIALQQKTGNFEVAFVSRIMQCSPLTEGKQKNELAA